MEKILNNKVAFIIILGFATFLLASCRDLKENKKVVKIQDNPELYQSEEMQKWGAWIKKNSYSIHSLDSEDYEDLYFLKDVLKDKRIVFLGEEHGVSEFYKAKVRLINYLHKELGYNIVAFEAGIGETNTSYIDAKNMTSTSLLTNSLFKLWQTNELMPIFNDVKQSKNPIKVTGFDLQPSSEYFSQFLKRHLGGEKSIDTILKIERDFESMYKNRNPSELSTKYSLEEAISQYEQLQNVIHKNEKVFNGIEPYKDRTLILLDHIIYNRKQYIEFLYKEIIPISPTEVPADEKYINFRDKMMTENLEWLANVFYKGQKIIVWAHNGHIMKESSKVFSSSFMGERLSSELKKQSYFLGFYAYEGKLETPDLTKIVSLQTPPKESLEDILNTSNSEYSFIDMNNIEKTQETSWIFQENYVSQYQANFVPKEQFDGIMFIKKVSPPSHIEK